MPPSPRSQKLQSLIADLSLHLRPLSHHSPPPIPQATGLPDIDHLLGGGFPTGALSEITGPPSSGRTSLLLALLARTTRHHGAHVALVDPADGFDPPSAEAAGVVLERVLWVRAQEWRAALRATECLLGTDGFPVVVLDGSRACPAQPFHHADAAWLRLARLAANAQSSLLLLSSERLAGSRAAVVLEMQPAVARFSAPPALLEELETNVVLVRHRSAPAGGRARLRLSLDLSARCTPAFEPIPTRDPESAADLEGDPAPEPAVPQGPERTPGFEPRTRREGASDTAWNAA